MFFLNKKKYIVDTYFKQKCEICNFDSDKDNLKIYIILQSKDSHIVIIATKSLNTKIFLSLKSLFESYSKYEIQR